MNISKSSLLAELRQFSEARIALGRTGVSLNTHDQMQFQLAHALARDAVYKKLDIHHLQIELKSVLPNFNVIHQALKSAAHDRATFLQRPDLGRHLNENSIKIIQSVVGSQEIGTQYDLAFVIADGLSAQAVQLNAPNFLQLSLPILADLGYTVSPICIVEEARVAIGDEICQLLKAKMVLVLIGERPGLSSPDSMGIYMTWHPMIGCTNELRNCISNIRPKGLSYKEAFHKLRYLIDEGFRREITGVDLKDNSIPEAVKLKDSTRNFLIT